VAAGGVQGSLVLEGVDPNAVMNSAPSQVESVDLRGLIRLEVSDSDDEGGGSEEEVLGAAAAVSQDEAEGGEGGEVVLNEAAVGAARVEAALMLNRYINNSSEAIAASAQKTQAPRPAELKRSETKGSNLMMLRQGTHIRFAEASSKKRVSTQGSFGELQLQDSMSAKGGGLKSKGADEGEEEEEALQRVQFLKALSVTALMCILLAAVAVVVATCVAGAQLDGAAMGDLLKTQDLLIDILPPPLSLVDSVPKVFAFITAKSACAVNLNSPPPLPQDSSGAAAAADGADGHAPICLRPQRVLGANYF
jgi:hypothetical protein